MEPESGVEAVPCVGFASLPRFLALDIFARLPADERLMLALVSTSWRTLVAEPSLWTCVDLSQASGLTRASDAVLLACSAKARGGMRSLDVCGLVGGQTSTHKRLRTPISTSSLLTTLRNNAHSLRQLRALCTPFGTGCWKFFYGTTTDEAALDKILQAAPHLTSVDMDISVFRFDASLQRNGVLSLRRLWLLSAPASFSAFLSCAQQCPSLSELKLSFRVAAPDIEALLDFALNKPLTALCLPAHVAPALLPSLTRLVSGGHLTSLALYNVNNVLAPSQTFCAAVAIAPLVCLSYDHAGLFVDLTAGLSLLAAVTGHPTLCHLSLEGNTVAPAGRTLVGTALGLLVAADSILVSLVSGCKLGYEGLPPLIEALPRSMHLSQLDCDENGFTQLAAAQLLAAVRSTTSLIHLDAGGGGGER